MTEVKYPNRSTADSRRDGKEGTGKGGCYIPHKKEDLSQK